MCYIKFPLEEPASQDTSVSHEDSDWGTNWEDTPVMKSPPRKPPAVEGSSSKTATPSGHDSLIAGETPSKSGSSSKGPSVGSSSSTTGSSKVCVVCPSICLFSTVCLYVHT